MSSSVACNEMEMVSEALDLDFLTFLAGEGELDARPAGSLVAVAGSMSPFSKLEVWIQLPAGKLTDCIKLM